MKRVGILFLFILLGSQSLHATLDGLLTPIYLDTRYSLSNYELVRGNVYFKGGFDLPPNGTVIIDITQQVGGNIVMNNGTLRLNDHLDLGPDVILSGSGYLDAQSNTIFFLSRFLFNDRIIIESSIAFDGQSRGGLQMGAFNASVAFTPGVVFCNLDNLFLRTPNNTTFFTASNAPTIFNFYNTIIDIRGNNFDINSQVVAFSNECFIRGREGKSFTITNTCRLNVFAQLSVGQGVTFKVNEVLSSDNVSGIVLDAAKLVYTNTTSILPLFREFSSVAARIGRLAVNGPCELEGPKGTSLTLSHDSVIQLNPGSNLALNPGTHLIIE